MKGKSTTTQLTQIFHLIGESFDNHGQVDALYLDFSKASPPSFTTQNENVRF